MEVAEAEIGEGRGVSEALEDAVEVAGVAEVPEAEGRSVLALESQQARLPAHLQPVVVVVVVVLVVAVGQLQGHQRRKRRRLLRRPPSSPPSAPALARAFSISLAAFEGKEDGGERCGLSSRLRGGK